MLPRWFLQEDCFQNNREERDRLNNLAYILKEIGCQVHIDKYVPFGGMQYDFFDDYGPVVLHGSINMIRDFQKRRPRNWVPAGWMDESVLTCSHYYGRFYEFVLNYKHRMLSFKELGERKHDLFRLYGKEGLIFVRPNTNDKIFTGGLISEPMFVPWYKQTANDVGPNERCVVAAPKRVDREWRLVMHRGRVVAGSQYMADNYFIRSPDIPANVINFAEIVATRWQPHPVWVLDICRVAPFGFLYVMEVGSVNCAGWYMADQRAIVAAINEAAIEEWANADADSSKEGAQEGTPKARADTREGSPAPVPTP